MSTNVKSDTLGLFLVAPETTVVEAMQCIDRNAKGILFVTDADAKLLGVVTDGDIRRWLIKSGDLQAPVERFMNCQPRLIYRKDVRLAQEYMQKYSITALPVVTARGCITDLIFREKEETAELLQREGLRDIPVVIMAGGKGTRLYPYTKILPKPLIPIGDIPIMERIIDRFRAYGVREFWATVNYKKGMIKSYFSENTRDYDLSYVEENQPLGTAGSLRLIENGFDRPFIVTNCDILIDADYEDLYRYHRQSGNELTIVTALKNIVVPYGVIHPSENGAVLSMEEKPRLSYFVNTGMYILNPGLLQEIPADTFYHMTDLSDALLAQGRKVGMYPISEESFLDMGEFEEMHRMEEKLSLKAES